MQSILPHEVHYYMLHTINGVGTPYSTIVSLSSKEKLANSQATLCHYLHVYTTEQDTQCLRTRIPFQCTSSWIVPTHENYQAFI